METTQTTKGTRTYNLTNYQSSLHNSLAAAAAKTSRADYQQQTGADEASYWANKFALGRPHSLIPKWALPRRAKLTSQGGGAAVVQQVLFGPPAFYKSVFPLAVVGGPRVRLYATTPGSSLQVALRNSRRYGSRDKEAFENNNNNSDFDADRQIPTGGQLALSAAFRHDGRLLAVGTAAGQIRVADATTRATVCTWQAPSKLPIRAVVWLRDGRHVLAAGDDGTARLWVLGGGNNDDDTSNHLSNASPVWTLTGHGDTVRAAAVWQVPATAQPKKPSTPQWPFQSLAFTGSYDHTVRVWNLEHASNKDRCLGVLSHGAPVEALLVLPSTHPDVPVWLISAGGTEVKVWNIVNGTCVSSLVTRHRKTITAMVAVTKRLDNDDDKDDSNTNSTPPGVRVLTAGLDGLLRFHSWRSATGQLNHVHGISLTTPLTALAVSENHQRLAIGTVDGTVLVRQRGLAFHQQHNNKKRPAPRAGTPAFFNRGVDAEPSPGDYVVAESAQTKRMRLNPFDVSLRKFRYGEALDLALKTHRPLMVVAVLEELGKRRGLKIALSNRDERSLEPLLHFLVRFIRKTDLADILIGVAHEVLRIYKPVAGESPVMDNALRKLTAVLETELETQKELMLLSGEIKGFLASRNGEDDFVE